MLWTNKQEEESGAACERWDGVRITSSPSPLLPGGFPFAPTLYGDCDDIIHLMSITFLLSPAEKMQKTILLPGSHRHGFWDLGEISHVENGSFKPSDIHGATMNSSYTPACFSQWVWVSLCPRQKLLSWKQEKKHSRQPSAPSLILAPSGWPQSMEAEAGGQHPCRVLHANWITWHHQNGLVTPAHQESLNLHRFN